MELTRRSAALEHIRQCLQEAPQLEPFVLHNVTPTGKLLGGGSYGVVEKLNFDGHLCAGKKIYDALIDQENEGAQFMVEKYYRECSLLSELRHPHIVQFLGICFLPDTQLPVLVMELLQGSLDELLESTPKIRLSTKLSILRDVTRGLVYLHSRSQPVIHRDLTARNVLLNSAMVAKVADLGNSRISRLRPNQLAHTMTKGIPGTLVYMPPEALGSSQRYGTPLDMFSFGHLSLFTAIQIFPGDLLTPTYQDSETQQVKARTELQRRERYISTLDKEFGKEHALVVLVKECLEYEPVKRPTAREALERLGAIVAVGEDPYSGMNRLQLENVIAEKEGQAEVQAKKITEYDDMFQHLHLQLQKDKERVVGMEEVCRGKDAVVAVVKQEISVKQKELAAAESRERSLSEECTSLKGKLAENVLEMIKLKTNIKKLQDEQAENDRLHEKQLKQAVFEKDALAAARQHDTKLHKLQLEAKDRELSTKTSLLSEKDLQVSSCRKRCSSLEMQLEEAQKKLHALEVYEVATIKDELKQRLCEKELQILAKEQEIEAKKQEMLQVILTTEQEVEVHKHQLEETDRELSRNKSQLLEKENSLTSLKQTNSSLQTQLDTLQLRNQRLEDEQKASTELLALKDAHLSAVLTELSGRERMLWSETKPLGLPSTLQFTLPLRWNKRIKLPMGVVEAQAAVAGGLIYFGGGRVEGNQYKLLIQRGMRGEIGTPVMGFAVAVVDGQLVIVGGRETDGRLSNQLWVLDSVNETWTQPFPEMPTARWFASAVGYKKLLLVVGGDGKKCVEVLDTNSKCWYTALQLPSNTFRPSLAIVENTLYVVWGTTAVSITIPMLFSDALSHKKAEDDTCNTHWKVLPEPLTDGSIVAAFRGNLLSLGAGKTPSSTVAMYVPQTEQWLPVAHLPAPRCGCACVIIPETEELVVIGGDDDNGKYIKSADLCTL